MFALEKASVNLFSLVKDRRFGFTSPIFGGNCRDGGHGGDARREAPLPQLGELAGGGVGHGVLEGLVGRTCEAVVERRDSFTHRGTRYLKVFIDTAR